MIAISTMRAQGLQAPVDLFSPMIFDVFTNGIDARDHWQMWVAWRQHMAKNQKQTRWFLKRM